MKSDNEDSMAVVKAVNAALRRIDERLIDHGERVAYIACSFCEWAQMELDMKTLFLLCQFHDIGAYKTEEIDRMVEFETKDVKNHAIYGYLFLKYMTPLKQHAEAILYHHMSWRELRHRDTECKIYAMLIHLADRIDIVYQYKQQDKYLDMLLCREKGMYPRDILDKMKVFLIENKTKEVLKDGSYRDNNFKRCEDFNLTKEETLQYMQMIVNSIDFRSEYTVTHTTNTISIAKDIAEHFNISKEEQENIYIGAMLHDVGKIAIPSSILESPERLNEKQMGIMRKHVNETENIIRGIVPEHIFNIAVRHHEKLDGSGYPYGLRADDLNESERIVAVADIVSALSSRRSYKEAFPKEKTIEILSEMSGKKLESKYCRYICGNYDRIMSETDKPRQLVIKQYQNIIKEYAEASASLE